MIDPERPSDLRMQKLIQFLLIKYCKYEDLSTMSSFFIERIESVICSKRWSQSFDSSVENQEYLYQNSYEGIDQIMSFCRQREEL